MDTPPNPSFWYRRFGFIRAIIGNPHEATAIGTIILAVATLILAFVAIVTLERTEAITTQSERAWISPVGAIIQQPFEEDKVIRTLIFFTNTGKQPAFDMAYNYANAVKRAPPAADWSGFTVEPNDTCEGLETRPGALSVYPSPNSFATAFRTFDSGGGRNPLAATKSVIDGTFTYYIRGCAAYRTFDQVHHSQFCFVIDHVPQDKTPPPAPPTGSATPQGPQTPRDFYVNCPTGNTGD